jgi:hypothetical protein
LHAEHGADAAFRTQPQVRPGEGGVKVPVIGGHGEQVGHGGGQQPAADLQFLGPAAVGEQAVVADALKGGRQGMQQKRRMNASAETVITFCVCW